MFYFKVQFNNFLTWYSFILEKTTWQLVIGSDKLVDLVATLAGLVNPSTEWTSTIRSKCHCPRWTLSSAISRRSPTSKFRRALIHFWRSCKIGKYSANHLFQKISVRYCTCLQRFLQYKSSFTKTLGGKFRFYRWRIRSRWFGVKGPKSAGLLPLWVNGQVLRIPATSAIMVCWVSPEITCSYKRLLGILRIERMIRSHTPPIREAPGGINFYSMFFRCKKLLILSWLQSSNASFISFFLSTTEVDFIVTPYNFRVSSFAGKSSKGIKKWIRLEGLGYLNMGGSHSKARWETSVMFLDTSCLLHAQSAKKSRFLRRKRGFSRN